MEESIVGAMEEDKAERKAERQTGLVVRQKPCSRLGTERTSLFRERQRA